MTRPFSAVVLALLSVNILTMIATAADARNCEDDTLNNKTDDGEILTMMSGAVYEVLPGDDIDAALWLPPEDVLICEAPINYQGRVIMTYEIINTEEGQKVGARRLR